MNSQKGFWAGMTPENTIPIVLNTDCTIHQPRFWKKHPLVIRFLSA